MTRKTFFSFLLLTTMGLAAELPTAEALYDRYIEATGGAKAYRAIRTRMTKADVEFAGQGIKGTNTTWADGNKRSMTVMELQGLGKMYSGVWDGVVWESSALQGQRLAKGVEKSTMLRLNDMQAALDWRKYYSKAVTEAEETVDGVAMYRVVATPNDGGKPETWWFRKDNGLLEKSKMTMVTAMGELPMEIVMKEYKQFGDLLLPVKMVQAVGPQKILTTLVSVEANVEVKPEQLTPPAEIQELIKKEKAN